MIEQSAAEDEDALARLAGGVAHDFGNLLTVLLGSLDHLAGDRATMTGPLAEDVRLALIAAERGNALTQRLCALARRREGAARPLDLKALVQRLSDLFRACLTNDGGFEAALSDELWPVNADPLQLEAALINLALNAGEAMPDGGRLSFHAENRRVEGLSDEALKLPKGDYVRLSIEDNGAGMSAEISARAFEPFFTTKPNGQGAGLGLTQVQDFVRQSGGALTLTSAPSAGTRVVIFLPRAIIESQNVLVVEDDPFVRALAKAILSEHGFRVTSAGDAEQALDILRGSERIDLLFTDLVLPGALTGPQLAAAARTLRPGLRVLFTSGYSQTSLEGGGLVGPGFDIVTKPYRRQDLPARVKAALERPS